MAKAADKLVYRPALTRVLALLYLAFAIWLLVTLAVGRHPGSAPRAAAWLLAGGVLLYALFWRPAVLVDSAGVELVNVVRTVQIPWGALESIDTRYALTLHAGSRRYTSWAAPAPSSAGSTWRSMASRRSGVGPHVLADPRWLPGVVGISRPSRDLRSASGAAAFMVETGWAGWRDRPRSEAGSGRAEAGSGRSDAGSGRSDGTVGGVVVRWDRPLLAVSAVALALLLVQWIG